MKLSMTKYWVTLFAIITSVIPPAVIYAGNEKPEKIMTVSEGKKVSIEYTVRLQDKSIVDTNTGLDPLTYIHGDNQIVRKLQKDMEGMKVGESKLVVILPEDGYGLYNEGVVFEVNRDTIPEGSLKEGTRIEGHNEAGERVVALIKEIKEKTVVLEHVHPLAGKILYFSVKILDIQDIPAE